MLSVSVIGGYLGAGKTTLVNHLLRHADGMKIAVLVNEFGALPIDADLIEAQDDALISIAGGCVCCSYGNDLIRAMLDLARLDPAPDHVLIESSGVALPGAIAASVSVLDGFHIDGIVVLADAETIMDQAVDAYVGDTVERQLAEAHLVVLNKVDLVAADHLVTLHAWLGRMAPQAAVVPARHGKVPNAVVMQAFGAVPLAPSGSFAHAVPFDSRVIRIEAACDAEAVAAKLADPALLLIRAKGFVATPDGMRAIQVVGRRWHVSDAPRDAQPGVVVIAQSKLADFDAIQAMFAGAGTPA